MVLHENQRGKKESTQDEEDVNAEESARNLIRGEMEQDYGEDSETSETIKDRDMRERPGDRNPFGSWCIAS